MARAEEMSIIIEIIGMALGKEHDGEEGRERGEGETEGRGVLSLRAGYGGS